MNRENAKKDELVIPLPNGGSLVCGPGEEYKYGGALTIRDNKGRDLLHWTYTEWQEDPECVIGAVFSAALKPLKELRKGKNG